MHLLEMQRFSDSLAALALMDTPYKCLCNPYASCRNVAFHLHTFAYDLQVFFFIQGESPLMF